MLLLIFLVTMVSCQKEKNEKELFKDLNNKLEKNVSAQLFKEEVYPNILELHTLNKGKYSLIKNIADKALIQKNTDIFKINVSDLKNEMKYIK